VRSVLSVPILLALASRIACAQASEWTTTQPLAKPTGRYAIGTVSFQMTDTVLFPDGRRVASPQLLAGPPTAPAGSLPLQFK
jgi:hypothetical protein